VAELLSLTKALELGRLSDFIRQEESRGIGPANLGNYGRALEALIKAPQSEDQTSRSPSRGGSSGK
jgi:hypothetical protein